MTPNLDSELHSLLERGKYIPPVPDLARARALARARSTATSKIRGDVAPSVRRRPLTIALAASAALAVLAATAVAAFHVATRRGETPQPAIAPGRVAVPEATPAPVAAPTFTEPAIATPTATAPRSTHGMHPSSALDSYVAELDLLHRAQSAYAGHDFAGALALVAEHNRRFPNGRLAEEREALRVRSLSGAGRTAESRRAAAAFAERFPRSVLVPRLGE